MHPFGVARSSRWGSIVSDGVAAALVEPCAGVGAASVPAGLRASAVRQVFVLPVVETWSADVLDANVVLTNIGRAIRAASDGTKPIRVFLGPRLPMRTLSPLKYLDSLGVHL